MSGFWHFGTRRAISLPPNKPQFRTAIGAGTGSGTGGGEENVQSDWTETDTASDAYIQNKPTIPTIPGVATTNTNGLMSSADKGKLDGVASGAEVNVQANWDETGTASDAYIQNKPTIPDLPSKPANPSAQTDYNLRLTTSGSASWVADTGGGGGGSTTFAGLTDTPASLGTAGQYLRVNSAGNALEFVAAPSGGGTGTSSYLPPPDNRDTTGGFFYMGWEDNFSSSWGIRRISLSTGAATTATVSNNSSVTDYAGAWSARTTLTYG